MHNYIMSLKILKQSSKTYNSNMNIKTVHLEIIFKKNKMYRHNTFINIFSTTKANDLTKRKSLLQRKIITKFDNVNKHIN